MAGGERRLFVGGLAVVECLEPSWTSATCQALLDSSRSLVVMLASACAVGSDLSGVSEVKVVFREAGVKVKFACVRHRITSILPLGR